MVFIDVTSSPVRYSEEVGVYFQSVRTPYGDCSATHGQQNLSPSIGSAVAWTAGLSRTVWLPESLCAPCPRVLYDNLEYVFDLWACKTECGARLISMVVAKGST